MYVIATKTNSYACIRPTHLFSHTKYLLTKIKTFILLHANYMLYTNPDYSCLDKNATYVVIKIFRFLLYLVVSHFTDQTKAVTELGKQSLESRYISFHSLTDTDVKTV